MEAQGPVQVGPAGYAVVDIDGVVADVRHRLSFLDRRPKDWDGFFDAAVDDPVLPEGAAVVGELAARGLTLVWVTGRPERCRPDTRRWLDRHHLPAGDLYMRGDRDRRPARQTKLETIRRLAREAPVAVVVDDDDAVVRTLRESGFEVLHARWMEEGGEPTLFDAQESDGRT
jgi:beta-phosphoglucomutase-like phosphatase (HAD superfamily)